jgi:hypothetical protein
MRQRRVNSFFTFLYPGFLAGGPRPPKDAPSIAIPNDGSFVSICGENYGGEQSSAVFYTPQSLRDMAHVLEEAADLFEENQAKAQLKGTVPLTTYHNIQTGEIVAALADEWTETRKQFDALLSDHQRALKAYDNVMNKETERSASDAYANLLDFVCGLTRPR